MSLTESPKDVERLASARAWSGWSYDIAHADAVGETFGFAGLATVVISIVQRPALARLVPRARGEPGKGIVARPRARPTTGTTSGKGERGSRPRGVRAWGIRVPVN